MISKHIYTLFFFCNPVFWPLSFLRMWNSFVFLPDFFDILPSSKTIEIRDDLDCFKT